MVALLNLVWVVGLLAVSGLALGLALLLRPGLKQWPANFVQQHLFPDANQISLKNSKGSNGASRRNVYRILCFGDSLTEGFTRWGGCAGVAAEAAAEVCQTGQSCGGPLQAVRHTTGGPLTSHVCPSSLECSGGINFHPYAKRLGDKVYAQLPQVGLGRLEFIAPQLRVLRLWCGWAAPLITQ